MNKPIIGFSDLGHLGENSAKAAMMKGFTVTNDLSVCDIVYISPDRPGDVSPEDAVARVLPLLRNDAILVILCQVEPGFTRKVDWASSYLYYQVETLKVNAEALDRALNPERIIVGYSEHVDWGDYRLRMFLEAFNCPIIPMSYESAELTKIAINLYLSAQIETSNKLSKVAEKIGANWDEIIPALQLDKRIGKYAYLKPGELGQHLQRDVDTIRKYL